MTEHAVNIGRYLYPEYWDGEMIGQGTITPMPAVPRSRGAKAAARSELQAHLDLGNSSVALRTYSEGETWNSDEHQPGTIAVIHREALASSGHLSEATLERAREGQSMASPIRYARPTEVAEDEALGLQYMRVTFLGVIIAVKEGKHGLFTVPEVLIPTKQGRLLIEDGQVSANPPEFTVGKTYHHFAARKAAEFIIRTPLVEIVSNGHASQARERKSAFNWGALLRPAVKHA